MKKLSLIMLLVLWTALSSAQTRRALVIGLGEQEDPSWAKINGDKDIPYIQEMLIRSGYKEIKVLANRQATKAGIVSAFKRLMAECKAGDVVYIHFSGHGQQMTDVNGDEQDGWDEAWIPYDAYLKYGEKDRGEKHLTDDEVGCLLTDVKNKIGKAGKLLVVVDACHSGDSSRNEEIGETVRGVKDEFVIPGNHSRKTRKTPERWLTLSACKDFQLNQELKSPQVGKLTYALYTLSKKGNITMPEIECFMARYRSRLPQTPMLTGETETLNIADFLR